MTHAKASVNRWWRAVVVAALAAGSVACSLDGLLNSNKVPSDVSDPAFTETPQGAQEAYNATLDQFRTIFGQNYQGNNRGNPQSSVVAITGVFSDELQSLNGEADVDRRVLPDGSTDGDVLQSTYGNLQRLRGQSSQAIGLLSRHIADKPSLQAHLYALEAYAEIFLAEIFCSGVPLSTVDYVGDFTYKPGSTTAEIFTHAVSLFDTALAMGNDSTRVVQVARVGRARALLALGAFADAAVSVAAVPTDYHYDVTYTATPLSDAGFADNFARLVSNTGWSLTVSDLEGFNGLNYRTSGDPRTKAIQVGTYTVNNLFTYPVFFPQKYDTNGASPLLLASGVEARLIEAEAALQAGDGAWLAILDALRTDGSYDTQPNADDPMVTDTLWHAGTGGVAGLAPLVDPGTASGRVDLVFRERAFWLFLTGHRQGDLRRLIRQYGRDQSHLYPVGPIPAGYIRTGAT